MNTVNNHEKHDIFLQMEMYHSDDKKLQAQAIDEIVSDHRKYISFIINKHFRNYQSAWWEDMFMAGVEGLLEALPKYDPYQSKPTTFFHFYILHKISAFVAEFVQGTTTHYANLLTKINRAVAELEKEGNTMPSAADISMKTDLPIENIAKALEVKTASQMANYESEEYLDSMSYDINCNPEMLTDQRERNQALTNSVMKLPYNEREVIIREFGLFGRPKQSNKTINEETGIPIDKIRYYSQSAFRKIRNDLKVQSTFTDYIEPFDFGSVPIIPEKAAFQAMTELVDPDDIELPTGTSPF